MRITSTSKFPINEVKKLVRFAGKDTDHRGIEVHVKNSKWYYRGRGGRLPNRITKVHPKTKVMCTVCIGYANKYPMHIDGTKIEIVNWQELLVWLAAHEIYHCVQVLENLPISERSANTYAHGILQDYRSQKPLDQ